MIFGALSRRDAVRLQGERSVTFNLARGRLVLVSGFFLLVYMFMAIRAFDLMVIQSGMFDGKSAEEQISASEAGSAALPAEIPVRGDITDRNGVLLATTLKTPSLFADPPLISDPQAAAAGLAKIFPDMPYGEALQKLQEGKRFVWLRRNLTPQQQQQVLALGEPGFGFRMENRRIYPQAAMLSHLVGFTDIDTRGQAGIERGFDKVLADGKSLRLSIDTRFQHALRREMAAAIKDFSAIGGVGVVMDVTNGEILAGVSLPDFDPHNAGTEDPLKLFNRLTLGVYELGSVFKIFSTAALLDTLNVPMSTTFDAREPLKRGRFTISDYHAEKRIMTIPEVFMYSSNIGSAMMGEAVGTEGLKKFYKKLGLLDSLENFDIPEVAHPMVPNPWRDISTLTASFGHGVATTPLQMASGVSAVVNGGYAVKPHLVISEGERQSPVRSPRVLSEDTSEKMRKLLRLVVTDGTGSKADVEGCNVGGKTGTAEKSGVGGYNKKRLLSSFVGVFPMDEPRYAIFIAIDEPKGTKASYGYATGGWVATPAVARVIQSMAALEGIVPQYASAEQDMSYTLKQYVAEKKH